MEQQQLKKRADVLLAHTWDLTDLYETRTAFDQAVEEMQEKTKRFADTYTEKLVDVERIVSALTDYEELMKLAAYTNNYTFLPEATDLTNPENTNLSRKMSTLFAEMNAHLSFFDSELQSVDVALLDAVVQQEPRFASYIRHTKENKKIQLDPKVEKALAQLSSVLNAPESIYEQARLADMDFGTFEVNGVEYPLSFVLYEDYYMYHADTDIRRAAFTAFSTVLSKYKNVISEAYYTQIQKEKTIATMRGFDSVIDYLLYEQEVERELYDRQIDGIMTGLAPVMQRYITHLKEVRGLDKMTYADLKISLDPDFSKTVTVEDSQEYVKDALQLLGQDYVDMIMKAYPERWVDFVQNKGKSTGGFCSSPYQKHPYILMSWTNQLSDVYTLIHEFGHAGQGILSAENHSILGSDPSLYLIEAPSTFNELLLTHLLSTQATNERMERFALTSMIANTYFHNYITHLLEATYQREVYRLVDAGQGFDADTLSELKKEVLEAFWGDAVEINPGAELTWMRQPHYYMGLYSYTYSAGLTIATQAFLKIKEEGQPAVDKWLEFLALGDEKRSVEAALVAGVDITTTKPLTDTIAYLDDSVTRIIELSALLKEQ